MLLLDPVFTMWFWPQKDVDDGLQKLFLVRAANRFSDTNSQSEQAS